MIIRGRGVGSDKLAVKKISEQNLEPCIRKALVKLDSETMK